MFAQFEQGVRKTEDCKADCSDQTYFLKARHYDRLQKTSFEILDDGIVTSIRLFYKNIVVLDKYGKSWNNGNVFAGV